jgi:hypothetical protein
VAGRFPLYADVRGTLIKGLLQLGWDVVRAIDVFPEGTEDLPHFERAVALGRVLVTNDEDQEATADQWYRAERPFPGVIAWCQKLYRQVSNAEILECFENLARQDEPFAAYPIIHLKPPKH